MYSPLLGFAKQEGRLPRPNDGGSQPGRRRVRPDRVLILGQGPNDDELAVFPDPSAVVQLPWRPDIAWCPGNLKFHKDPWPMCSRTILAAQVERARKMGFRFNLGIECEIYIVRREGDRLEPANPKDVLPRAA